MTAGRLAVLGSTLLAILFPTPAQGEKRPEPPDVTAAGAVLWDPADERVLYGVDEARPRPMASTTKIMTALLAVEAASPGDELTVSDHAAGIGGATLGLHAGQTLPLQDVLAGLLLQSGNDAAVAVAEHVAGSEPAFVEAMNDRAAELGLADTSFVNASGLTDDPSHASSPRDLARLAEVVLADRDLAALVGSQSVEIEGVGRIENRNELLRSYPGVTGVKTGFTELAGQCLVASARRGDRSLYAVALGSDDSLGDVTALLDHGFDDFRRVVPVAADTVVTRYRWPGAVVDLLADGDLGMTVPVGAHIAWRTDLDRLRRPVEAGTAAGQAALLADGRETARVGLRTAEAVPAQEPAAPAARIGAAIQEAVRAFARTEPVDRAVDESLG